MNIKSLVPALYIFAAAGFYLCMSQAQGHPSPSKVWPVDALLQPMNPLKSAPKHRIGLRTERLADQLSRPDARNPASPVVVAPAIVAISQPF